MVSKSKISKRLFKLKGNESFYLKPHPIHILLIVNLVVNDLLIYDKPKAKQ